MGIIKNVMALVLIPPNDSDSITFLLQIYYGTFYYLRYILSFEQVSITTLI